MNRSRRALLLALALCAVLSAQQRQSAQATSAGLDKMTAAGKSQKEMAQYVFDNHGCNGCHTAGQDGKLGFTAKGKQLSKGFEGCVRTLTAMNMIAQVSAGQRSENQKVTAKRFEEFGCTLCHQVVPGKMALTNLGAKLTHLHLGCAEVEKTLASR